MLRTPLGVPATVLGASPGPEDVSRVWVRLGGPTGLVAPLDPTLAALRSSGGSGGGSLAALGYRAASEAATVRAALAAREVEAARVEEEAARVAEVRRLLAAGEPVPEHLLRQLMAADKSAGGGGGGDGSGGGGEAKGKKGSAKTKK